MVINNVDDIITDESLLYFGSHNFSPNGWGRVSPDGSLIHMVNWELGIVFPPKPGSADLKRRIIDSIPIRLCKTGCRCDETRRSPMKYILADNYEFKERPSIENSVKEPTGSNLSEKSFMEQNESDTETDNSENELKSLKTIRK